MLDSKALQSIPLVPANTADPAPEYPWPKPYNSAMFLSFDVDAESAWTSKDAVHAQRLITMSYGGYEARVGTPKLLELLEQLDLKATFFVTGWSVDAHPAMAEAILKAGHEIGHQPDPGDPWIEEELERGFEALKRRLGVRPTGYRAPYGEFTEELRVALVRHGIVYTSSFRDDVRPYRHRLADGKPGTIELPVTASYDDWMHGLSARFSPRSIFPQGACALDLEGRARRNQRLGRDGDDRAASTMQRSTDAAAPAARIPDLRKVVPGCLDHDR
ncbi:hypothetical protein ACVWZK_002762 [Bradyrhizobium sp. GM0.4]